MVHNFLHAVGEFVYWLTGQWWFWLGTLLVYLGMRYAHG